MIRIYGTPVDPRSRRSSLTKPGILARAGLMSGEVKQKRPPDRDCASTVEFRHSRGRGFGRE